MHYDVTYLATKTRSTMLLDATDAATAVTRAKASVTDHGNTFELISVIPRPDPTPPFATIPSPRMARPRL